MRVALEDVVVLDLTTDPDSSADRPVLTADRDQLLWAAFSRLPGPCQRLLRILIADPPLPYERVSELLDMPIGSIGPTRARCLQKMLSAMEGTSDA